MTEMIHGLEVHGVGVDGATRCAHWYSPLDIIAIKFKCCGQWFPCFKCHTEVAGHEAKTWPAGEFNEKAILCGSCGHQLSVAEYLNCGSACPSCSEGFNPGCAKHAHLYFGPLA